MDFLQQAVARAKSQHEPPIHIAKADEPSTAKPEVRSATLRNIEYSETRRINSSPLHLHAKRILNPMSDSAVVSAYKILRTQILHKLRKDGFNSFAVVSANQAEGKSLTAVNLAISLAQEVNHTVLLVDFDLMKPSIHRYFGFEPEAGIGDYLYGRASLASTLVNPGIERLVVLPGREQIANSSEMLSSPEVVNLINDIKNRYENRIVVFDLPSMLHQDDALAISPYVDALLVVIAEGETGQQELVRIGQLIGNKPVLGTVLNKSQRATKSKSKKPRLWGRLFGSRPS
jgi:capsular exopolysaccharide synthesis family protein